MSVVAKMSDSSEHSESEFYYPDELSDNELLEKANSLETKLVSDENIKKIVVGQKQENTVKKTKYDMNVFFKFLREVGETREVKNIPSSQLDKLLCKEFGEKTKTSTNPIHCPRSREAYKDRWTKMNHKLTSLKTTSSKRPEKR